jgi:hypothetical protein
MNIETKEGGEISGCHGGGCDDFCVLGCCAMYCMVLAASISRVIALMMEAVSTSGKSLNLYQTVHSTTTQKTAIFGEGYVMGNTA